MSALDHLPEEIRKAFDGADTYVDAERKDALCEFVRERVAFLKRFIASYDGKTGSAGEDVKENKAKAYE